MEYVYVGRIITTHGIKGEIKIRSNFKYKDKVFVVGNTLYIGKNYEERKILSYRVHKDYDMVMLDGLDDIDKVIHYKNLLVFVSKDQLKLSNNQYVNEETFTIYIGNVEESGTYRYIMAKDSKMVYQVNKDIVKNMITVEEK